MTALGAAPAAIMKVQLPETWKETICARAQHEGVSAGELIRRYLRPYVAAADAPVVPRAAPREGGAAVPARRYRLDRGRLNELMRERGLSSEGLAAAAGVSANSVRYYRDFASKVQPSARNVAALANVLGVRMEDLMAVEDRRAEGGEDGSCRADARKRVA